MNSPMKPIFKSKGDNGSASIQPRPNDPCWCGSGTKYKRCHQDADLSARRSQREVLTLGRVRKGSVSQRRRIPEAVPAPDYATTGIPPRPIDIEPMQGERLRRMRRACQAAAKILHDAGTQVRPGTTTDAIDAFVHEQAVALGAYPSPLNYRGFPKSLCTSVNEVICHGIPDDRALLDGDIVNLDVTIYLDGMHGDCNATFPVGAIDAASRHLVDVTQACLRAGVGAVTPGRPISDIGRAIEAYATHHGYGVVRSYCGHGIGEAFHSSLQVPHYFDRRATMRMEPGMTFTIEPMICIGSPDEIVWDDQWTAVTKDLQRSAQFEHTVLVTADGVEVLTEYHPV